MYNRGHSAWERYAFLLRNIRKLLFLIWECLPISLLGICINAVALKVLFSGKPGVVGESKKSSIDREGSDIATTWPRACNSNTSQCSHSTTMMTLLHNSSLVYRVVMPLHHRYVSPMKKEKQSRWNKKWSHRDLSRCPLCREPGALRLDHWGMFVQCGSLRALCNHLKIKIYKYIK